MKEKEKKPYIGYKIEINRVCVHHEQSEELWGSWSASYENS